MRSISATLTPTPPLDPNASTQVRIVINQIEALLPLGNGRNVVNGEVQIEANYFTKAFFTKDGVLE
jgi:hypothetical protein